MRIQVVAISIVLLASCTTPQSEFANPDDFTKPIADGLYFIREVTSGGIWKQEGKARSNWELRAEEVCRNEGYKILLFSNMDTRYATTGMVFVGATAFAYPSSMTLPQVDGVVHCKWSSLSEEQAIQVLKDEYYLLRGQP